MEHLYEYQVRFQCIAGCSGKLCAVCWQQAAVHSNHGTRQSDAAGAAIGGAAIAEYGRAAQGKRPE